MARKILLADDSVTAQNMGRKILADAGYEVITVNNGSAALKKITEHKPDLIVLDVYMPGYSGLEVCQRLKEARETARIPVLLTVGKLEPFKPEEAKRARADAFIVKPFEASELLSALAKLEDRIVPKAESSKPGRFARAIAAVEGTKNEAVGEEEIGWKNRISFPSKKEKTEEAETEDPAIYNPVNRDLRTVLEQGTSKKESKTAAEPANELSVNPPPTEPVDGHVDVTAVASMGLPKDVTPEEIAALAAAVAQVQAKVSAAQNVSTPATSENSGSPVTQEVQPAKVEEAKAQEAKAETLPEVKTASSDASLSATFASQPTEADKAQTKETQLGISHADAIAAIAALEPTDGKSWGKSLEEQRSDVADKTQDVPVTMAVAAASASSGITSSGPNGSSSTASRWAAVPVALDRDEASISLEHEMQKAYAAFAAAEANHPGFVTSAPTPETSSQTNSSLTAVAVAEPVSQPLTTSASEFSQSAVVSVTETSSPEVQKSTGPSPSADAQPVVVPEPAAQATVPSEPQPAQQVTAVSEAPVVAPATPIELPVSESLPSLNSVKQDSANQNSPEQNLPSEEPKLANLTAQAELDRTARIEEAVQKEAVKIVEAAVAAVAQEFSPVSSTKSSEPEPVTEPAPAVAESAVDRSKSAGGADMTEHRESEAAAAWASWRQIRESGDKGKSSGPAKAARNEDDDDDDAPAPASQPAAMAVAAGAEKNAEKRPEAPAVSGADSIASIVDSVLADLRPKIVEEISKKLGEKK